MHTTEPGGCGYALVLPGRSKLASCNVGVNFRVVTGRVKLFPDSQATDGQTQATHIVHRLQRTIQRPRPPKNLRFRPPTTNTRFSPLTHPQITSRRFPHRQTRHRRFRPRSSFTPRATSSRRHSLSDKSPTCSTSSLLSKPSADLPCSNPTKPSNGKSTMSMKRPTVVQRT